MKKSFVLLIASMLLHCLLRAQFTNVGSKWYYSIKSLNPPIAETLLTYEAKADTVIQIDTFSKIQNNLNELFYLQQQNKKTYYWLNNKKQLLFDASLVKGDTISIDAFFRYENKDTTILVQIILDSILYTKSNSININDSLKVFRIKPIGTILGAFFYEGYFTEKVIHSSNYDLSFLSIFNWPSMGNSIVNFRCFNSIFYNFKDTSIGTKPCDFIRVGMENIFKNSSIKVYPNPSKGIISVDYFVSDNKNVSILLKDLLGETIYTSNIDTNSNTKINSTIINLKDYNIPSGLYILHISNGIDSITHKLIIE